MRFFKQVLMVAVTATLFAAPQAAQATPITGGVSFGGVFEPTGGDLADATGIDVSGNAATVTCALAGKCVGSYAVLNGAFIAATYNDFTFAPLGGTIAPLWSFDFGGKTYSFTLTSVTVDTQTDNSLVLLGSGLLSITGFDSTPAAWSFSGDTSGTILAFSATNSVPEPVSTVLLGLGLLGAGVAARRRR